VEAIRAHVARDSAHYADLVVERIVADGKRGYTMDARQLFLAQHSAVHSVAVGGNLVPPRSRPSRD
jgi:hypothetical protein